MQDYNLTRSRIESQVAARERAAATTPRVVTDWHGLLVTLREQRTAAQDIARAALTAGHRSRCDAPQDWLAAPSGRGERTEQPAHRGSLLELPTTPLAVRSRVAEARRYGAARRTRLAVLAAARASQPRRTVEWEGWTAAVRVSEPRSTRVAPRPLTGMERDALTGTLTVGTAVEALILQRDRDHATWSYIAASEPKRDGRGTVDRTAKGVAVNGTEVRANERWTMSKRSLITTAGPDDEHGEPTRVAVDWGCYRVNADGSRTALVSTATAKRRKRASAASAASKRAALQAVARTAD